MLHDRHVGGTQREEIVCSPVLRQALQCSQDACFVRQALHGPAKRDVVAKRPTAGENEPFITGRGGEDAGIVVHLEGNVREPIGRDAVEALQLRRVSVVKDE